MEIFKKQIRIDQHISRQHSLIPYINNGDDKTSQLIMDDYRIDVTSFSDNGNWGKYPYDIDLSKCASFIDFRGKKINPIDLKVYFQSKIVSFLELSDKFNHFKKILREAKFLMKIKKNRVNKWVEYTPTLREKLSCEIVTYLPSTSTSNIIGIHQDSFYADNGGSNMLSFLIKAMGLFIINETYVDNDNGVPEIMYYTGIKEYLSRMELYKNSDDCCKAKEYEFLGGEVFYHYLKLHLDEIEKEIIYWYNALNRDINFSIIVSEPHISIDVALNSDANIIGNYMCVKNTETEELNNNFNVKTIDIESQLKYLRRSKITYCEKFNSETKDYTTVEFPLILDEIEINGEPKFKLSQPYQNAYPSNLTQISKTKYYGDMIYRMEFVENEKKDDKEETSGVVNIYYVLGGELNYINETWSYVDNDTTQDNTPKFTDFIKNPNMSIKWTVDNYLFLKNELSKTDEYKKIKNLFFKGEINSENDEIILRNDSESEQTWVYKINYRGKYGKNECYPGDYLIFYDKNKHFHFTMKKIQHKKFSGIRYYEQKSWVLEKYRGKAIYRILMMINNEPSFNILSNEIVINSDGVEVVDYSSMNEVVTGVFSSNDISSEMESNNIIMKDYDFGIIDFSIENTSDILIDRGFVSAFEMHYKLGEINTMEDMENYGNNFFGF